MIHYLRHGEIDKVKWDACIDRAQYNILYGYSWYLDIVSPAWDALIEDDYETVFPLTWKKKYGLHYLTQPNFAQQLGIFSIHPLSGEQISSFLDAIPKTFLHYDLYMNPLNECPLQSKYFYRTRKTYHVHLNAPYAGLFQKYSGDTKRNLKKFSKKHLHLNSIPVQDVIELYKRNVWYKTPALKMKDYLTLNDLSGEVAARKKCLSIGCFENEVLSAGAVFFISGDKIIFVFGSANLTGRRNGAMRFIFDHVIRTYANRNLVLDFEGSSVKTVEYFYKSFGPDKIIFTNIRYSKHVLLTGMIEMKQKITKMIARKKIISRFAMK